jgi:hypothetical protein
VLNFIVIMTDASKNKWAAAVIAFILVTPSSWMD